MEHWPLDVIVPIATFFIGVAVGAWANSKIQKGIENSVLRLIFSVAVLLVWINMALFQQQSNWWIHLFFGAVLSQFVEWEKYTDSLRNFIRGGHSNGDKRSKEDKS